MSHHFRFSTLDLNDLGASRDSLMFWESKIQELEEQMNQTTFFEKRFELEEKWAIASKRRDEVYEYYKTFLKKVLAFNEQISKGCMGSVITRSMLELVCFVDDLEFPSRRSVPSTSRGWQDKWDDRIDFGLACRVIDLGLLKPKHGDAFWWLEKTNDIHRVLFWHDMRGVILPDTSFPDRPCDVPSDLIAFKKSGAYRDFIPPLKHD